MSKEPISRGEHVAELIKDSKYRSKSAEKAMSAVFFA